MKKSVLIFGFAALILLSSCVSSNRFSSNYVSWYDDGVIPEEAFLKSDETPEIINETRDIDEKFREISSNWYWCIGHTEFNASDISTSAINSSLSNLCKENGATLVVWVQKFTNMTRSFYTAPHTNYHVYSNGFGGTYTYTTTSYTNHYYSVSHYDYIAYFFVPIPESYKMDYIPGFSPIDFYETDDVENQNKGCYVDIVYKNTSAYSANLKHGDLITRINGTDIRSANDFYLFRKNASVGDIGKIKIVRDGAEKEIELIYGLDQLMY